MPAAVIWVSGMMVALTMILPEMRPFAGRNDPDDLSDRSCAPVDVYAY